MELVLKLSKEQGRLHVVFTSSDSFFQRWIEDQGMICYFFVSNFWKIWILTSFSPGTSSIHIHTFVLGDLSKSDGHRYFLELVKALPLECQDLFPLDEQSFDEIFHLTGGRMVLIEEYVYQGIYSIARTRTLPNGEYDIAMRPTLRL